MPLPPRNLLAEEASPYLRQHAGNPVHWRPWSQAALADAEALGRPILVSIGYAACHWCHVMAHESFENADVAAVMNRLFVNIKVDREERPDIDQIYMAALSAMGEQGGWPLTMFLTPKGKPFWGGTYFPPQPRYGRPGFVQVLEAVDKAWRDKAASLAQSADQLTEHVGARLAVEADKAALRPEALETLANGIYGITDTVGGGLRGAPKFPNAPFLHTLWLSWLTSGNRDHRDAVLNTLEAMLRGGIYDHVGGGLCRYSTDTEWLVPHFEKMLYDNAQLLRLCNWAYAATGNDLFRIRIEETAAWLLREMRTDSGCFAASLDADSEGEEGLFYTWTRAEIDQAGAGPEFDRTFTLADPPGWEGKPILCQTADQCRRSIAEVEGVKALKQNLLSARERRIRPARDDKVLADWNGLAIVALAECGRSLQRPEWIDAARLAFDHILSARLDGRLPHSMLATAKLFPALSTDYAAMGNAAIALFEATGKAHYLTEVGTLLAQLDAWHGDANGSGHYLTAADSADTPLRIRGDVDEAIPSATAQIIEAKVRYASLAGDMALMEEAYATAEHATGRIAGQAYGQAGIINASMLALQPMKLVLMENPENPLLVPVANQNPDPRRVDQVVTIGTEANRSLLPDVIPRTDRPGAYLCTGQVCLPPVSDPGELESLLRHTGDDA
ncbi:MAG: thioredoxin domain-containing protein [Mesorhizobium sp.]|nr:thioredoxin domain-containing protein [Mesorhizobium sp.]MBN9242560.1 thioredoxin domain-containing protein [Mesorhizobium sp.]